ncbi:hypothetical protein GCM10007216_18620 [Thalassobacillus devorans]|uniref:Uncharacterized protein n=1 Tax=Thalassobacillus devorans TaxID=279813 RepID=A0ABQ1NZZ0_9BACI|nr:hypothetical protein [Thalassobacillus devorans]NIK28195.1 hypothetical protein [Thalassobacillus devorans]GGC88163.1 hypothetical protein GCM10007216_18620 [Thalassobacillus devorans]
MRLELLENGIDSVRFGMEFYHKYLSIEDKYNTLNPGYLKMSVISFHNALELFSKKLLSDENELLIYRDLSDPMLLDLLQHRKNREKGMPLDYYVISDQVNILTIDYIECVKRLGIIYNLSNNQIHTLDSIGKIRNKVTHFGLDKTIDFHEVLTVINSALNLITGFFYDNLNYYKENPLDSVYEELLDLMEIAEAEENESWEIYYADNFEDINYIFDSLNDDEQFKLELFEKGYTFKIEFGSYSHSATVAFKLMNKNGDIHTIIKSFNIPRLNVTLFTGDAVDGPIYFAIDQFKKLLEEDKHCYVYKNPEKYIEFEMAEEPFWEKHSQKNVGKCYGIKFNEEQLKRIIKDFL